MEVISRAQRPDGCLSDEAVERALALSVSPYKEVRKYKLVKQRRREDDDGDGDVYTESLVAREVTHDPDVAARALARIALLRGEHSKRPIDGVTTSQARAHIEELGDIDDMLDVDKLKSLIEKSDKE